MEALVREYDAKMDSRRRVTLRNGKYPFFHVLEYADGRVILEPRELVEPFRISPEALQMMDESIQEIQNGGKLQTLNLAEWKI